MSVLAPARWRRRVPWVFAAGTLVLGAYAATVARTVTRWDAGEFLAAVHSLGIPHPPGTPLYVLLAHTWARLPLPGSFALRVNLFSAVSAAVAVMLLGFLIQRWTRDAIAAAAATLAAGGTYTLWLSATEAEVYAPALLFGLLLLVSAECVRGNARRRWALLAFGAALGWTLHPGVLVTLPAAMLLAFDRGGEPTGHLLAAQRTRGSARAALLLACATVAGLSAVLFLLVRAQHDPPVNQGNPATVGALWDVLSRAQYPSPGLWPRQAPLWLQFGNWFEYADWQVAFGLAPDVAPAWRRTPVTVVFALLGVAGSFAHRRLDRRGWRALLVILLSGTAGLILFLNLRLGPSFGYGFVSVDAVREARERDYFFIVSYVILAAWAGMGAVLLARAAARRPVLASRRATAPILIGSALALSLLPLVLNFVPAREQRAVASQRLRRDVIALLEPLPDRAVFLAFGDNDTYPLWYVQEVEGVRRDVLVVTIPLLATSWYRDELIRRHGFALDPRARGTLPTVREVCRVARAQSRELFLTPFAPPGTLASCPELRRQSRDAGH